MITVFGLDISSSVIGYAILSYNDDVIELTEYGHIKPPGSTKGTLAFRASSAYDDVKALLEDRAPDIVSVEAYANKFPRGKSTARTIIVLSVFNELMAIACLKGLGYEPNKFAVPTIRSEMSKLAGYKITSKEECFDFIIKHFSNFKLRNNRNGKITKACYDEADAIAVALTYILKKRVE